MSHDEEKDEENYEISLEKFASYTTLHGFQFTISGHHPVRRVVWILAILLMLVAFGREVYYSAQKLSKHGITFSFTTEYEDPLIFPAISICNINAMKKSKTLGKDAQAYLDTINGVIPKRLRAKFANKTFNLEEAIIENGHQLKDMLVKCSWGSIEQCSEKNFTVFYSSQRGLCYTFNSGEKGHRLLSVPESGPHSGLKLVLNPESDEYYGYLSYESYGFKVMVHNQGEIPLHVDLYGYTCSAGHSLQLSLSKQKIGRLDEPPAKKCKDKDGYSKEMCILECGRNVTAERCGCKEPFKTPDDDYFSKIPNCNFANENITKCTRLVHSEYRECRDTCPEQCNEVVYMKSSSVFLYPAAHFWSDVQKYKNSNPQVAGTFGKHVHSGKPATPLARIRVYYETMEVKSRQQLLAYDIEDFLGDLGGFLGLCLGCSILTLGEVFDAIISWCLIRRRNKNRVIAIKK